MPKHTHITRGGRYGVAVLLLLGTSAAAIAQQMTPAAGDAMVHADTATHMAELTGTGEGTAWFAVDEQNNSIRWSIEYTGIEATGASIMCPADAGAAAVGAPAAGADADMGTTGGLTGQITRVDRAEGAAPAAGGADTPAPAAGADAGPAMAGDMTAMAEVVNLLDEGGTMTSPIEGQTADLDEATFRHISTGACFLEITVASTGGADAPAANPATPAPPAVTPAP